MALVECPDCGRRISDRAKECPDCMCPVAAVLGEQREKEERERVAKTRASTDREVDCPNCEARGYLEQEDRTIAWCIPCEHSGRLMLCTATDGFYAVATYAVERFLAAEIHPKTSGVAYYLGENEPREFRFKKAGERHPIDPEHIPWELEDEKS